MQIWAAVQFILEQFIIIIIIIIVIIVNIWYISCIVSDLDVFVTFHLDKLLFHLTAHFVNR